MLYFELITQKCVENGLRSGCYFSIISRRRDVTGLVTCAHHVSSTLAEWSGVCGRQESGHNKAVVMHAMLLTAAAVAAAAAAVPSPLGGNLHGGESPMQESPHINRYKCI